MAPKVTIRERVFNNPMLPSQKGVTTVMIGLATKGPVEEPVLVSTTQDLEAVFGKPHKESFLWFAARKYLPYSPNLFVARIADSSKIKSASAELMQAEVESNQEAKKIGEFVATSKGTWGNDIEVKITRTHFVGMGNNNPGTPHYSIDIIFDGNIVERYINVNFDPESPNFIGEKIGTNNKPNSAYVYFNDTNDVKEKIFEDNSNNPTLTIRLSGGHDGESDETGSISGVISSLERVIEKLADKDKYVFDIVIVPEAFSSDSSVISSLDELVKTRNDCFAPIDPPMSIGVSPSNAVENAIKFSNGESGTGGINLDNKNLAFFAFWQKDYDPTSKSYKWFPPSIYFAMMMARMQYNTGVTWNSIAGMENGKLNTVDVQYSPSAAEREKMYGVQLNGTIGVVNPIVKFAAEGIVLWGQRTTERSEKPTNRINVVMMLNYVKQELYKIGKKLQFQLSYPGSPMWGDYITKVTDLLNYVMANGGCENFSIADPSTVNTPEVRANNKFIGKIKITPTNVAEEIDFIIEVTPAGVNVT